MNRIVTYGAALLAFAATLASCSGKTELIDYVDPMIGSGGHGHVFVGANVPFGMVQLGPQQIKDEWDWCSGYQYSDTLVIGFSHTHLSGTGIGDLGDILIMPYVPSEKLVDRSWNKRKAIDVDHVYAHLDHELETVVPGYYTISLPDYGVEVELTATERVGYHRYTFSGNESALLVDLCTGIGWDGVTEYHLDLIDETHIAGYRRSSGWANDHIFYFYGELSVPYTGTAEEVIKEGEVATALLFDTSANKTVELKIALSPNSVEGARLNLESELPQWGFEKVKKDAQKKWNQALSSIEIEPMDARQAKLFYTSLYHTMIAPSIFNDVDESANYTTMSLWDTYRAAYPLMTIINDEMSEGIAEAFMKIYEDQGKLPVWHLAGCETDCMVGNPGVIIMADLCLKGYVKDVPAALEAMKVSANRDERGMEFLKVYGYIPFDKSAEVETVSKGLEFAIADASLAKVAKSLGMEGDYEYYYQRGQSYHCYFDPETRFVRGRHSDGSYRTPFDPFKALHMRSDFTEGNAWQYTWLVPQDPHGLIEMLGGEELFLEKLDSLFIVDGDLGGDASDVTGLIGQYAHGNEPSHHVTYLYNYAGEQHKCAEKVRYIMDELYFDDVTGVCGNEDVGQMSAWYVLSSMGLYQVDPADGVFVFGSPAVKSASIKVGGGKVFTVKAVNNSPENIYIGSARFNGEPYTRSYISYEQIKQGGTLEFVMTSEPTDFGCAVEDRP